jgi:phage baseplate assembly protein W
MPITRHFKDLNLLFSKHPITKDVAKHMDNRAIIESIKNLIFTKNFERPMHPELGCNVMAMLFENIDPITGIKIKRSIEDVLRNFEPRIRVEHIQIDMDPDKNAYKAAIVFSIQNRPEPIVLPLILERLR